MTTTEELTFVTTVFGGLLAFILKYAPIVSPKFAGLSADLKKLVASLLSVVIAAAVLGLACGGWLSVSCPAQVGIIDWLFVVGGAILGNQSAYALQRR